MPNRLRALLCAALFVLSPAAYSVELQPRLEDFAFLTGYWSGNGFGGVSEEMWMPGANGSMFGIFKQSGDGGLEFTEYMEITRVAGEFVLRLKHFNPDFSGWEEKNDYVTFPLRSLQKNQAVFGGLTYTLTGNDRLRIELRLPQSGDQESTEVFELLRRSPWP